SSGWSGLGIPPWPPTPPRSAAAGANRPRPSRGGAREHRPADPQGDPGRRRPGRRVRGVHDRDRPVVADGGTQRARQGRRGERSADGEAVVWGTVTRWEPPAAVAFTWHPGRPAQRASYVAVTFGAEGGQ